MTNTKMTNTKMTNTNSEVINILTDLGIKASLINNNLLSIRKK